MDEQKEEQEDEKETQTDLFTAEQMMEAMGGGAEQKDNKDESGPFTRGDKEKVKEIVDRLFPGWMLLLT